MTYAIAYDVATSYSGTQLEFRRADSADNFARTFANAERAWFGDVFFDGAVRGEPLPPCFEPGYALVLDRAAHGRPQSYPRDPHVVVREYFDPAALLADAQRYVASGAFASAIGIRVVQRKPAAEPAWDAETRALHAEILAHPDADDPRLVFADALGTKRAGLVIVQCDLARDGLSPAESRARRRAQRELLAKHGKPWSRLEGLASSCRFRRGFVEAAQISRDVLVDHHARVFDAAPLLDSITLDDGPPSYTRGFLDAAARDGWWSRIRGLSLRADQVGEHYAGMFGSLRALELANATPALAHALVASGELGSLETLRLPGHRLGADAIEALVAATATLRVLDITAIERAESIAIPRTVRELAMQSNSALPAGVEKLEVHGPLPGASLESLPELRAFDLWNGRVAELHELTLPKLRELRLSATPDGARAIARRFGAQLELLTFRDSPGRDAIADELREMLVGDVTFGTSERHLLLVASYLPDEPMWDVATTLLG
ncbi:MAG TPA: hypothetical protein VGG28_20950 [Kofleriaceae bacterium]